MESASEHSSDSVLSELDVDESVVQIPLATPDSQVVANEDSYESETPEEEIGQPKETTRGEELLLSEENDIHDRTEPSENNEAAEQESRENLLKSGFRSTSLEDPLTFELFDDPVTTPCGHRYDRDSISEWMDQGNNTCPLCRSVISKKCLQIDHTMRARIGLPEMKTPDISEEPLPPKQESSADIVIDQSNFHNHNSNGNDRYTCLCIDHQDSCSSCFCDCARAIEWKDSDTIIQKCCGCALFSGATLGSDSTFFGRSCCGLFYPFWLLLLGLLLIVEIILRLCIIFAVIVFALCAIFVILILICIFLIVCLISCILSSPCIFIACCCGCFRCCLEVCMNGCLEAIFGDR